MGGGAGAWLVGTFLHGRPPKSLVPRLWRPRPPPPIFSPRTLGRWRGLAIKALVRRYACQVVYWTARLENGVDQREWTGARRGARARAWQTATSVTVHPPHTAPRQLLSVPHAPSPPPLRAPDRSSQSWWGCHGGALSPRWWLLVVAVTRGARRGRGRALFPPPAPPYPLSRSFAVLARQPSPPFPIHGGGAPAGHRLPLPPRRAVAALFFAAGRSFSLAETGGGRGVVVGWAFVLDGA